MNEVDFRLSPKNFKLLVKLAFFGDFILSSNKTDSDSDALMSTLFGLAKNYNIMKEVEFDQNENQYFVSAEKEAEWLEILEEYEDTAFWENLQIRLGRRDFLEKNNLDISHQVESGLEFSEIDKESQKYDQEFKQHGVSRLRIVGESR